MTTMKEKWQPQDQDSNILSCAAISAACTAFGLSTKQFFSDSRLGQFCNARRAACNLMYDAGITNCRMIALRIHRTHATVYHHLATHKDLYLYDLKYHKAYDNAKSIMAANVSK